MVLISVLPLGLLQAWASVEVGTWWARSAEFMQQPVMNTIRWLRVPGDTVFAIGALVLGWFVLGLRTGWSLEKHGDDGPVAQSTTQRCHSDGGTRDSLRPAHLNRESRGEPPARRRKSPQTRGPRADP